MNEIIVRPSVEHQVGSVVFHNYEQILSEAQELAEYVSTVVVTEESVKATKKMLAEVNKKVTELEDGRKQIKKELLAPYEEFEKKIKSITSVVKEADSVVRSQVRELEERERDAKREEIVTLFRKRVRLYPIVEMFAPSDFIKPMYLNKSVSMKSIEEEMVKWFEQRKKDVEYIKTLDLADDILVEYVQNQDVIQSVQIVNDRHKAKQQLTKKDSVNASTSVTIVIDENDLKTVEAFMTSLKINYTLKRG